MTHPQELNICNCCKDDRINHNEEPRVRVPVYTQEEPAWLCEYCDGDALRLARDLEARLAGE